MMKSKKIFQKLKLQKFLENVNKEILKKNEWLVFYFRNSLVDKIF